VEQAAAVLISELLMNHGEHPPRLTPLALQPPVRCVLNSLTAEVLTWDLSTLHPGTHGLHGGVYHVHGLARDQTVLHQWAVVLKIVCPASAAARATRTRFRTSTPDTDPTNLFYWQREARLFESNVLANLAPTLNAPTCYGVDVVSADAIWVWLEHIVDSSPAAWELSDYARAAEAFGVFGGSYLGERPVPSAPWVATDFLRRFAAGAAPAVAHLARVSQHPVLGRLYPSSVVTRVAHIWHQRDRLVHALDRLPQTFCHFDAHRGNLLLQAAPTGTRLIVIDWATAGAGPIGADAGMLMGVATQRTVWTHHAYDALDATIFACYLAGLRRTGWQGDERLVRFGYTTTIALRIVIGYLPDDLHTWLDDSWYASMEAQMGLPIGEFADQVASPVTWLVARAEEALALLSTIEHQFAPS
jgi:Phosphotransferase enzyme family